MITDDGLGLSFPVLEMEDLCIFEEGEKYVLKKRHYGEVKKWDKARFTPTVINELRKEGWRPVSLEDTDDEISLDSEQETM